MGYVRRPVISARYKLLLIVALNYSRSTSKHITKSATFSIRRNIIKFISGCTVYQVHGEMSLQYRIFEAFARNGVFLETNDVTRFRESSSVRSPQMCVCKYQLWIFIVRNVQRDSYTVRKYVFSMSSTLIISRVQKRKM